MNPTPEQTHQALLNYFRPLRTPGAKVKAAIDHAKTSTKTNPGGQAGAGVALTSSKTTEDLPDGL